MHHRLISSGYPARQLYNVNCQIAMKIFYLIYMLCQCKIYSETKGIWLRDRKKVCTTMMRILCVSYPPVIM